MSAAALNEALSALHQGRVIAYPTEAVYGLGCDPDLESAVESILSLKQRPRHKGMILIAASYQQLRDYVDDSALSAERLAEIQASWPGPVTWVMPKSTHCPDWISGDFDSVAVRVTDHPLVVALCEAFGKPLISTSANPAGESPAVTAAEVTAMFGEEFGYVLDGATGGERQPSRIFNAIDGQQLR